MDTTKREAGPAVIVGAVVLLAAILYLVYHFAFAGPASNVSKENAPDYAKKAGMTSNPTGEPAPPAGRPQYGQGAGYAGGQTPGVPMGAGQGGQPANGGPNMPPHGTGGP
jgi:hypothetical protein